MMKPNAQKVDNLGSGLWGSRMAPMESAIIDKISNKVAAAFQPSPNQFPKEESKLGENSLNGNLIEEKAVPAVNTSQVGDDDLAGGSTFRHKRMDTVRSQQA